MSASIPKISRTRRTMLANSGAVIAGAAALAAIGTTPATHDPDADLVRICAKAEALHWQAKGLFSGETRIADEDEREAALEPIESEAECLADEIFGMQAATLAAHRARARILLAYHGTFDLFKRSVISHGTDGVILAALIRDLAD